MENTKDVQEILTFNLQGRTLDTSIYSKTCENLIKNISDKKNEN